MPFIRVYIHFVWSTKNRYPYLANKEVRAKVWQHIRENARAKNIFIDFINGYSDHCHCLVSLGDDQTLKQIMQAIKGESSHWINKNNLTQDHFEWQNDYFVVGVSEAVLPKVRNYIKNQETHHHNKTFQEEYDEFMTKFDFKKFSDE